MKKPRLNYFIKLLFLSLAALFVFESVDAQKMDRIERERFKSMLTNIKNAVKKDYYDANFHGINLEERFQTASERLEKVNTTGEAMGVIAQALLDFDDSHLYFLPPATNIDVEYGWRMQMFGDKCFVTIVKPKSDAEAKGLKVGDQILAIENFRPNRKDLWKINYYYNIVGKRTNLRLSVLRPGDEEPRQIQIESKIKQLPKVINWQMLLFDIFKQDTRSAIEFNYFKYVGNTTIWKMPSFAIPPDDIDTIMSKIKGSTLILDLRGNGGGYVVTLEKLAGYMFDKDLHIAELKGRKEMKPQKSKTKGKDAFAGKLIVLVDNNSGSAAEIFARLVQLEKRGVVLGDVSAGAVMQSRGFFTTTGANDEVVYGASITNADVIMSDGKSLEHVGVIPDELLLPTGQDLANQRDPVLAKAIELAGGNVSPDDAGKFFRYKWRENTKEQDIIEIEVK
jgi:C-terminal processing protease CtpA/Prc